MISHRNVIANTIQISVYDASERAKLGPNHRDVALGLLPQSHIYALIVICHVSTYLGDEVVVLPRFDISHFLNAIQRFKINSLYIVPPIIIAMVKNHETTKKYDLSSVRGIFTGAAPLGKETAEELASQYPSWQIRQGYGLTETCTVVCSSSPSDIWFGSSGCLIPGYEAKIMTPEGVEITEYNKPGELLVKSPSVVLGYLKNDKATQETFVDLPEGRFMRTGDEVEFRVAPSGNEHVWVVDRIKELIKVKVSIASLFRADLGQKFANAPISGPPSRPRRTRSLPAQPPRGGRLRRYPCGRRSGRRGPQGLRREVEVREYRRKRSPHEA